MNERQLAKELLEFDAAGADDAATTAELTRRVLDRDKRRVRITAWLTAFCWIAAIATLYWSTISLVLNHGDVLRGTAEGVDPVVVDLARAVLVAQASIEGVMFALLCTMLLVFFSRRATLRQVNASLQEISARMSNGGEPAR